MSRPPQTTILFSEVPRNTANWLIGIDTSFFGINSLLKGIKNVPGGIHFLHYSLPSSEVEDNRTAIESSIRYGQWVSCTNDVIVLRWDANNERFQIVTEQDPEEQLNFTKYFDQLGGHYNQMLEYPEKEQEWKSLIHDLDQELLEEFVPFSYGKFSATISTVTPSKEENMILLEQLASSRTRDNINVSEAEPELAYTIIEFKKNRGNTGQDLSSDYLDKSWYLEEIYGFDLDLLLGELELSFTMFVILGNFCSGLQWLNLLKLISMSKSFMASTPSFSLKFLGLYAKQLEKLPREYMVDEVTLNSAVDMKRYTQILENFVQDIYCKDGWLKDACCGKMKVNGVIMTRWQEITKLHKTKFGIDLESLETKVDHDQMEVFDMNNYDENDEYVPTIVR